MKYFIPLMILLFTFWSNTSAAQKYIDLFKVDYAITPSNVFDSSKATTAVQEINGDLTIPISLSENVALLTGLTYEMTSASFDPNRSTESLTGLTLKLGANIKHSSKWSGTYMFLPKISSDFIEISNQDVQFGAAVLMKYQKSDHLNFKFGVYGNRELFGPFIVPIFGFYYLNPSGKFEAKVLLPLAVDLNYSIKKEVRIGLNFKGQVRTYNINQPIAIEKESYMARSTNDVYAYVQKGMKNGINIQFGFGRSIGRSYRMYSEKVSLGMPLAYFGDNRKQLNSDFSDSWLFKVGATYRFKL